MIGAAEAYGGLPDALGYLARQARDSLDDSLPASMRDHATRETCVLLADSFRLEVFEEIIELGRSL